MSIWTAVGGLVGAGINQWNRKKDQERQDNQLQRMTADAKLAGISPLAALGGSTSGYAAPVGSTNTGSAIGDGIAAMGNHSANKHMRAAQAENAGLQNDLLRAQIDAINSDTVREATGRTRIPTPAAESEMDAIDKFVRVRDNKTGELTWALNPDLAMEKDEVAATLAQLEYHRQKTPHMPSEPGNYLPYRERVPRSKTLELNNRNRFGIN